MSFVAGKIFWYLTQPGNLLLLMLVAGWLLLLAGARRLGHLLLGLGLLSLLAVAVLPVGSWLMVPLEDRFPARPPLEGKVDGIVVLGGSIDSWISAARDSPALNEYADRMTAAVILAGRHPEARILVTGGEAAVLPEGVSEGPYMRRLLVDLGIGADRIEVEDASRNTAENAREARRIVNPAADERWVLVTSAFHMPRALGCFRRLGWDVVPYPVDYKTTGRTGLAFGFNLRAGLERVHLGLKEWMALVAYRLLDHTDTLFPAPAPP